VVGDGIDAKEREIVALSLFYFHLVISDQGG